MDEDAQYACVVILLGCSFHASRNRYPQYRIGSACRNQLTRRSARLPDVSCGFCNDKKMGTKKGRHDLATLKSIRISRCVMPDELLAEQSLSGDEDATDPKHHDGGGFWDRAELE